MQPNQESSAPGPLSRATNATPAEPREQAMPDESHAINPTSATAPGRASSAAPSTPPNPTLPELLDHLNAGKPLLAGTPLTRLMSETAAHTVRTCAILNTGPHTPDEIRNLMSDITGRPVPADFRMFPPFNADFGKNIHLGHGVFLNAGCKFQDQGGIFIADGAFIGHNVVIATLNHDFDPAKRADLYPSPVHIGKGAWLGANVTVLPGVTIGDGAVIAAGAVVTKSIPPNMIAVGSPAKPIRSVYEK